jgi:hypothetical protein
MVKSFIKGIKTELRKSCWLYCFKRGDKAVFLNRKDQVIKEFNSYEEAEQFANKNIHLIDAIKTESRNDNIQ